MMKKTVLAFVLLVAFTAVFSCRNPRRYEVEYNPNDTLPKSDTAKPVLNTSFKGDAFPLFFEAAYDKSTTLKTGRDNYTFSTYEIGKIKIESGKIIAGDPIIMQDEVAFTTKFPKGEFPVQLALAVNTEWKCVAFSRIVFSDKPVAKWEFALHSGEKQINLKDSVVYSHCLDGGMSMFIDSAANYFFNKQNHSVWEAAFMPNEEGNNYKGRVFELEGHNLATFTNCYGDGCFATYIGYDEDGNICRLLTDFGLVEWSDLD